eukprot:TRINITY_DN14770_c0_g1_i1.p1 TRINITY_DN14770_c0_g1~~TRINITY_DN14770_c0_g1_i1.p1  ORF type:complete len:319 (-),score=79.73 TRINITY_DN14770_c0_g1_i1:30-899(-)
MATIYCQLTKLDLNPELKTKSEQNYRLFLELAPKGHRKVPEVYYNLAILSINQKDKLREYYEVGKKEEEALHPFFSKKQSSDRTCECLESLLLVETNKKEETMVINLIRRKKELLRVIAQKGTAAKPPTQSNFSSNVKVSKLPDISIEEMAIENIDKVFEKRVLKGTVVSCPVMMESFKFLLMDIAGNIIPVYVYNSKPNFQAKVIFGRNVRIAQPYYRIATCPIIRVDDSRTINIGEIVSLCWYCCLEKKGLSPCNSCNVASYCSTKCQSADWEEGHQTECKIIKKQS